MADLAASSFLALAFLGAGCATVSCQPAAITVADKDERTRLERQPRGLRTTEFGRVEEIYRDAIVTDYWLRDETGRWHRVPEDVWRAARVGAPAPVCR